MCNRVTKLDQLRLVAEAGSSQADGLTDTLSADIGRQFSPADGERASDLAQIYPVALREP